MGFEPLARPRIDGGKLCLTDARIEGGLTVGGKLTAQQDGQALAIERGRSDAELCVGPLSTSADYTLIELRADEVVPGDVVRVEPGDQLIADGEVISSTHIRALIEAGDFERANACLGSPFQLRGPVAHGDKRGRTLGFPTANLVPDPALEAKVKQAIKRAKQAAEMRGASAAGTELALRAASYGVTAWPVDGMDVIAVHEAAERAVAARTALLARIDSRRDLTAQLVGELQVGGAGGVLDRLGA